jgi:hypothetical protein
LRNALGKYVSHARKVTARGTRPAARGAGRRPSSVDTTAVRAWARENGVDIKERGRVPADVVAKYQAAVGALAAGPPFRGRSPRPAPEGDLTAAPRGALPRGSSSRRPAAAGLTRRRSPNMVLSGTAIAGVVALSFPRLRAPRHIGRFGVEGLVRGLLPGADAAHPDLRGFCGDASIQETVALLDKRRVRRGRPSSRRPSPCL